MRLLGYIFDLFHRKADFNIDHLRFEFCLETREYVLYCSDVRVYDNEINGRTRRKLKRKNKELKKNPNLLNQKVREALFISRLDRLKRLGYPTPSFEYTGDNVGTMSDEVKDFLNRLTDEDALIGIYRAGKNINEDEICDIFKNGIPMTSHLAVNIPVALDHNISYYPDNKTIIKEVLHADAWKESTGSFLVRIPDSDLISENIYITDADEFTRLNPKYVVAYVPLEPNHHIERIVFNPHQEKHDYAFVYDGDPHAYRNSVSDKKKSK